ncbi:MAG: twin-arginine translocase TatA/TatE family subunit [Acidimicrobiales bacterium]
MLDLTPVKLLILFIVVVVLAGPDKVPQVARQIGAGWRRVQEYRDRLDQEVRQNIPDLPSSEEIVRFARSPISLLDQLAHSGADDHLIEDPGGTAPPTGSGAPAWPEDPLDTGVGRAGAQAGDGVAGPTETTPQATWLSDDPSMN